MAFNFRFLSNNVNGLPSSKKLVKMFKGQIVNKWQKDFEGERFFFAMVQQVLAV